MRIFTVCSKRSNTAFSPLLFNKNNWRVYSVAFALSGIWDVESRITAYQQYGKSLNCFALIKQTTELKNTDAPWLSDCPWQALQMTLRNQDNAYTAFFKGGGFPKFKSKHGKQSFQLPQAVKVDFEQRRVFLPKLKWVDCVFTRFRC